MSIRFLFLAPALALLLSACAGTPGCGDSDTKELLDEIIEQTFQGSHVGRELRPTTGYKVRAIRMVSHDKDADVYECAATLELQVEDLKPLEREIEYDIYSVQDEDADFQIHYDDRQFNQIILDAYNFRGMSQR